MDGLRWPASGLDGLLPLILVATLPDAARDVVVAHLVEDTITGHEDKVVVLVDLEVTDLRLCLHDMRVPATLEKLCLRVAESPGNGETARQHADGPDDVLGLRPLLVLALRLQHLRGDGLVDLAAGFDDALVFGVV